MRLETSMLIRNKGWIISMFSSCTPGSAMLDTPGDENSLEYYTIIWVNSVAGAIT